MKIVSAPHRIQHSGGIGPVPASVIKPVPASVIKPVPASVIKPVPVLPRPQTFREAVFDQLRKWGEDPEDLVKRIAKTHG